MDGVRLSLISTTDLHGRIEALPLLAGYVGRLRELRERDGGVVLLDAGDMFQGTLESNLDEGRVVFDAYRALGYDAVALGNHEFDYGPVGDSTSGNPFGALEARLSEASFPVLAANLVWQTTRAQPDWPKLAPSALLEVASVRVGVIGALTEETPHIVMPAYFRGLAVVSMSERVKLEAARLRKQGARLVVLLAHAGGHCSQFDDPMNLASCKDDAELVELLRELPAGTVDLAFGGHTHQAMAHVVSGVPVAQAWAYGRGFARIDAQVPPSPSAGPKLLVYPPQTLCKHDSQAPPCEPHEYEGATITASPAIARLLRGAQQRALEVRSRPVGVTVRAEVTRSFERESDLGNLLADLLVEAVPGSQIALLNGGGIRADLPAGELRYGQLYEVMPFDNRVTILILSGRELRAVIARHLGRAEHGILSVGGMAVRASCVGAELQVELRAKDGKLIDDAARLSVVVSDYLATGGDGLFDGLALSERMDLRAELTLRDAFAQSLSRRREIAPAADASFSASRQRMRLPSPRPVRCAPGVSGSLGSDPRARGATT